MENPALSIPSPVSAETSVSLSTRWVQLVLGLVCMMSISSPQYVWTLFTKPLTAKLSVSLAEVQWTISILIILQTFFSPFQGVLIDKFGPKALLSFGAALTGISWVLAANASSLSALYLTYGGLGGIGTGIVYVGVVGLMVKWFPDKRGFACGMVAAGYGMGAILTTIPVSRSLTAAGFSSTLSTYGMIFGIIGIVAALCLRMPPVDFVVKGTESKVSNVPSVPPKVMLTTPVFWLMFAMMTMMSTSGLMVVSQMAAFAKDFGVAQVVVFGMAALPLALTIDRFTNGLTRPFFGWVSDRIGRENTMTLAFTLEGCAMFTWLLLRNQPIPFVLLSGVVFFGWGEIFSLFPSTLTDTFGPKHGTTNYGFLYMAQGIGSILGGPLAALLYQKTGTWITVFALIIAMDFVTAILAFTVLKPMRKRYLEANHVGAQAT